MACCKTVAEIVISECVHRVCDFKVLQASPFSGFRHRTMVASIVRRMSVLAEVVKVQLRETNLCRRLVLASLRTSDCDAL